MSVSLLAFLCYLSSEFAFQPSRGLVLCNQLIFFLMKKSKHNTLAYYQSAVWDLNLNRELEQRDLWLPELMQLLCEWVSFSITLLIYYSLKFDNDFLS
jgi:hypothetical protein